MSDELMVNSDLGMVPSFHAIAVNATEMAESKSQIKLFLEAKVEEIALELAEMQSALDIAILRKWAHTPLKNQVKRISKRKLYYEKLLAAMKAGFVIVPNMAVDVFAIRRKDDDPSWNYDYGSSKHSFRNASPIVPDERAQELAIGVGDYQSPLVEFSETHRIEGERENKLYHVSQTSEGFKDIEFPLAAAHPIVMDATNRAMVMKIFDRIGIVPQTGRKLRGDPIILGQIIRRDGYSEKVASFLIAWHLDMRTL
jgi:hypothetical protein